MTKPKFLTEKAKQAAKRSAQLQNFRNWLSLNGYGDHVAEYVGMMVFELRAYIESLWQSGMTWENYRKEWCVDHIVALKYFDPFNFADMELCWNYNNLIPARIQHNHCKGYHPEVSLVMLRNLPKSTWVDKLIKKAEEHAIEFEEYYDRPITAF